MRDRTVGETFFMFFTTRAFATGIPTVLAGTPVVSAYEDNDLTQITAGITLGVDHDGVVGLNLLTLVATGANGYEAAKDYSMVITTGTVGGVSVVGEVVGEFSLGLGAGFTRLGAPAGASVSVDIADLPTVAEFNARTLVAASYFDPTADAVASVTLVATTTTNTDMRGTDSGALASVCTEGRLAELDAANLPAVTDAIKAITDNLESAADVADAVFDEDIVAAHGTADTAGLLLRVLGAVISQRGNNATLNALLGVADTAGKDLPEQTWAETVRILTASTNFNDISVSDILTTQMTQSYAADGVAPTLAQALFLIQQILGDFNITGTTLTIREIDGSTTAATFTLDDSVNPTDLTRTT